MHLICLKFPYFTRIFLLLISGMMLQSCGSATPQIKDRKRELWSHSNPSIQKYYHQYRSNNHVKISLQRAQPYLPYIHRIFWKYKLPPELAFLPLLESSFDPNANSGHAVGMWQFTKPTAEEQGLRVGSLWDERRHWRKSTEAAAKYLSYLGKEFHYNWDLALAAYNGGPNYLKRLMQEQQRYDFWQLTLRPETQQYVPKFLAMLHVAQRYYPELYYKGAPRFWIASRN